MEELEDEADDLEPEAARDPVVDVEDGEDVRGGPPSVESDY